MPWVEGDSDMTSGPAGGLSSQFGMVDEVTFGTPVTVSRFLEFNDETVSHTIGRLNSSGLRAGRRNLRTTQWVPSEQNVTGDIDFEVQQQGFGLVLKHMLGGIASTQPAGTTLSAALSTGSPITSLPVVSSPATGSGVNIIVSSGANTQTFVTSGVVTAGATSIAVTSATPNFAYPIGSAVGAAPTVWEHTATVGQLDGKSYTAQIARGDSGGTVRAFTYSGCKIAKWDLSCAVDGLLMLKPTVDGIVESTAVALATATYAADSFPLAWNSATITLPSGAVGNISKFDLTGDNGLNLTRYFMAGTGATTKKEQIESTLRSYSGTIDVEFDDLTAYSLFTGGTVGSLTAFFTGPLISSTYHYALEVTLPAVRFDGATPNVPGPGVITTSMPFTALDDGAGTGGVQMVYRTTDTAP